jgi:CRP-like cAMP-binding protein
MATKGLESHAVFRLLRPEQLRALSDAAEDVVFQTGSTIFSQGDRAEFFFVVLEGKVALRMRQAPGVSVEIDEVDPGEIFGSCVCMQLDSYSLTAQCTEESKLLMVKSATLKRLLDGDPVLGYTVQSLVSRVYFKRYLETMKKLQSVVSAISLKAG